MQQCQKVTADLAKHPEVQTKIAELRTKMMNGELDREAMQAESQKIYKAAGVDAQVARACNARNRQGGAAPVGSSDPMQVVHQSSQSGGAAGQSGQGAGRRGNGLPGQATASTRRKSYGLASATTMSRKCCRD